MINPRIVALTYKTFPVAPSAVYDASLEVLKRMGMRALPSRPLQNGGAARILASAWRRQIHVELEPAGLEETRMRVLANDEIFFEENAAAEFIGRVARRLEHEDRVAPIIRGTREAPPVGVVSAAGKPLAVAGS